MQYRVLCPPFGCFYHCFISALEEEEEEKEEEEEGDTRKGEKPGRKTKESEEKFK